jgi:cobalt/nickel transport system permease protein
VKDRLRVLLYLCLVVLATTVHHWPFLAMLLAAALLAAWRDAGRLAARAGLAVLVFNAVVTAGYAAMSLAQGNFSPRYVLLMNLRVYLLTFLTLLMAKRVDPYRALAFSPTLCTLIVLVMGQLLAFRRAWRDFAEARRSRILGRPAGRDRLRQGAAAAALFLARALAAAEEQTQGMRSRGCFDD